ncbi:MAG: Z-DNA-binding protein [Microviridae sp.]|nr:MAG: Z-DNA-binding protein [Microviridae sp.]
MRRRKGQHWKTRQGTKPMQYRTRSVTAGALRTHGIRWGAVPQRAAGEIAHATAYAVYCVLMTYPHGWAMNEKQLGEVLNLTKAQVDAALERLDECGLMEKDPSDPTYRWVVQLPHDEMAQMGAGDYYPPIVPYSMKDRTQRAPAPPDDPIPF